MNMDNLYDVIIIGGGPAGLTAALYLARAKYRVLVVEKERFGGQITITSEVVNYPGVRKTDGSSLTETMRKQAESFGAEFLLAEVTSILADQDIKMISTNKGERRSFGILLATGAHPRKVGFRGEEEFRGHGVAYCATCDGEFFTDREVFVVGGGFAAAEESVFLTKYAKHVTILMRGEDFTCARATAESARNHEKITVLPNTVVEEVKGDEQLKSIRYRNTKTGKVTEYDAKDGDTFGVFVFAGYEPATELLRGIVEINEQGYVVTDRSQKTSAEGIYAAGDVCVKSLRQVVTAVGDGALAATELERYAAQMQQRTGMHPQFQKPQIEKLEDEQETGKGENRMGHGGLFQPDMLSQLQTVFGKMEEPLLLKLYLNSEPISVELVQYMEELANLTEKLTVQVVSESDHADSEIWRKEKEYPCVQICKPDGQWTGLAFHGVPGGHEFTSFVLGLYNVSGPGQPLEEETLKNIREWRKPAKIKVLVSLSCTMCPELVTAVQRIAAESPYVEAEVYDLNHFPELKDKYKVMSVPCMVFNDSHVSFGKKNVNQVLAWMKEMSGE